MFKRLMYATLVLISISLVGCGASNTTAPTYKLSGTVSGLNSGSQVILLNNGSNATTVSQSGNFSFSSTIAKNGNYAVTVGTQPANQTCTVTNDTGTGVVADVTDVTVSCVANAQFVYVPDVFSSKVYALSINDLTGAITTTGSATVTSQPSYVLALDPARKFLYVGHRAANTTDASISVFGVHPTTGVLTEIAGSPFSMVGQTPRSMTLDPTGKFLYVTDPFAAQITVFQVNSTTGALSSELTNATGLFNTNIAINPTGNFAYVADFTNNLSVFSINTTTGALTPIPGSPFAAGSSITSVILDSAGKYAYTTNYGSNSVSVLSVNSTTGGVTPVATTAAGIQPWEIALSPNGKFIFAANATGTISAFNVNSTTGTLTSVTGSPFSTGTGSAFSIAIDANSKFAYSLDTGSSKISVFAINNTSGALTAIPGSPFLSGSGMPLAIKIK